MHHARKSILRTARLHKERDRANRRQHHKPYTRAELMKCAKYGWQGDGFGYHVCKCSACGAARLHWARQSIKRIEETYNWRPSSPPPPAPSPAPAPLKVLIADAPDPSARRVFDAIQALFYRV